MSAFSDGLAAPTASSLNFAAGQTIADTVLVKVGGNGKVDLRVFGGADRANLILDVNGYTLAPRDQVRWGDKSQIEPFYGGGLTVACASSVFCMGVDSRGSATSFDGTAWSTPQRIDQAVLTSVSCPSAIFCMASDNVGDIVQWNGASWSAPLHVTPTPVGPDSRYGIANVSCTSSLFCAAVTFDGTGLIFDGTAWSAKKGITFGGGAPTGVTISCVYPSYCVHGDNNAYLGTYGPSGWSSIFARAPATLVSCATTSFCVSASGGDASVFDGDHAFGRTSVDPTDGLTALSCPTTNFCLAGNTLGQTFTFDGTNWTGPNQLVGHDRGYIGIGSISCADQNFCVATDNNGDAYSYSAGSWGRAVEADRTTPGVNQVSCVASGMCRAVDDDGGVATLDPATNTWSAPVAVDTGYSRQYISCVSDTFCALVDAIGRASTFDGTRWSTPVAVSDGNFSAVSCASAVFCMAVGGNRTSVVFDGHSWTMKPALRTTDRPYALSCTSSTFCALGDLYGQVQTFNGTAWSATRLTDANSQIISMSCVSTYFCMTAAGGHHFIWNGYGWSAPLDSGPAQGADSDLSCASVDLCVAVGKNRAVAGI